MDEDTCMVDVARRIMHFYAHESCGWCIPCREGTTWLRKVLDRFHEGGGREEDIPLIDELSKNMLGRGRGEGTVGGVVDAAQPPPRGGLARPARPVDAGVGGHVGLVDGHRGQAFAAGGGDGGPAEDKGAREVDQVGAVTGQRGVQVPDRQADPEAAVTGQRHGGQPHHRPRERVGPSGPAGRVPGRRRGDDHRLVPAQGQVLGHPQRAMRDTVHIGREGFGNYCYSHAHNLNHEMPKQDMTQLCVEELWATFCGRPHLRLLHIRPSGAFPCHRVFRLIPLDFRIMYSAGHGYAKFP